MHDPPVLDDGPHLGYAVQWIIFSICAVIGWFLIVRKTVKANDQKAALAAREQEALDATAADPSAVDEDGGTNDAGVVQQLGDDDRRADLDVR